MASLKVLSAGDLVLAVNLTKACASDPGVHDVLHDEGTAVPLYAVAGAQKWQTSRSTGTLMVQEVLCGSMAAAKLLLWCGLVGIVAGPGAGTCEGHVRMQQQAMGQVQVHCLCLTFLVNSSPAGPPLVCTSKPFMCMSIATAAGPCRLHPNMQFALHGQGWYRSRAFLHQVEPLQGNQGSASVAGTAQGCCGLFLTMP